MKIPTEYPGEQGQFSPGVNSKRSLQETVEMDCRMESLRLFHQPPVLCKRLSFPAVTQACLPC